MNLREIIESYWKLDNIRLAKRNKRLMTNNPTEASKLTKELEVLRIQELVIFNQVDEIAGFLSTNPTLKKAFLKGLFHKESLTEEDKKCLSLDIETKVLAHSKEYREPVKTI